VATGTELYIWSEKEFSPGGTIILYGNAGSSPEGNIHLAIGSTLTAGGNITLAGSWTASSSATFSPSTYNVTFTATTSGKEIRANAQSFYNIIFNGTNGEF